MVPRFKSLSDFMLARKWFTAQWASAPYFANAERYDIERRLRRHFG